MTVQLFVGYKLIKLCMGMHLISQMYIRILLLMMNKVGLFLVYHVFDKSLKT